MLCVSHSEICLLPETSDRSQITATDLSVFTEAPQRDKNPICCFSVAFTQLCERVSADVFLTINGSNLAAAATLKKKEKDLYLSSERHYFSMNRKHICKCET